MGKKGGTIRTRSGRRVPQCADAVSRNMPASARRSDVHHPNANGIWRIPGPLNSANNVTRTMKGATAREYAQQGSFVQHLVDE